MRGGEEGRRKDGSGAGEREAMAKSAGIEDKRRPEGPRRAGRQRRWREDVKVRGRARRGCSPHLPGSPPTPPAPRFPQASPTPIDLPPAVTHLPPSPPTAVVAPRAAASCPPPLYCRPRSGPQDALPARTSATKPPVARPPLSPPTFDLRWPFPFPLALGGPGRACCPSSRSRRRPLVRLRRQPLPAAQERHDLVGSRVVELPDDDEVVGVLSCRPRDGSGTKPAAEPAPKRRRSEPQGAVAEGPGSERQGKRCGVPRPPPRLRTAPAASAASLGS